MCLGIPGEVISIGTERADLATVEVAGVRRAVNIGMLDDIHLGDYVLVHVGFAMSKINEHEAEETLRTLQELGAYQDEFEQFSSSMD